MNIKAQLIAPLAVLAALASNASAQTIDFNNATINGGAAGSGYLGTSAAPGVFVTSGASGAPQSAGWSSTAGVNSTGALTSSGQVMAVYNTPFATAGLNTFTVSVMVFAGANSLNSEGGGVIHLGFGTDNVMSFAGSTTTTELLGIRLQNDLLSTTNLAWFQRTETAGGNGTNGAITGSSVLNNGGGTANSFSVPSGSWYLASASFVKSATLNVWDVSASVVDFGVSGLTPGVTLSSVSGTITQAGTYGASGLYAGVNFRNGFGNTRFTTLDTFTASAIPEPSAFAAIAGLGVLGLAASRRRRRHA